MKDIKGYEGLYAVTSCGKVWSYRKKIFLRSKLCNGYQQVCLYKDGKMKTVYIHRLVAETYIPNPLGLLEVNHKDESKEHNYINNLEWCDRKYNNNYGTHNDRVAKANYKPVFCIELNTTYESVSQAAKELGVFQSAISACLTGKRKSTGGYHFKYAE